MSFLSIFKSIGSALKHAFEAAQHAGVTDELIHEALPLIHDASIKYVDNDQRRESVVAALVAKHIPESIARTVVELAYQAYRAELKKVGI